MDAETTDVVLEMLQGWFVEQKTLLTSIESGQVSQDKVAGFARRLEDVADAVERLKAPVVPLVRRPWWFTPGLMTLALCVGVFLGWESLRWRPVQVLLFPPQTQQVPQAQKGRK